MCDKRSYDLGVDIELADAVNRLRFEHPAVRAVVITSGKPRVFCAGANIFMLRSSSHAFKVNFCKFTNETRLAIEDAGAHSGQRYLAAVNGPCSGGGYELALACDEIVLIDDRSSTVSLPEVPSLGVLPGTGGLTRLVDKRHVRRDRADAFASLAEGIRGKRAVEWRLVDAVFKRSKFKAGVAARARALADRTPARSDAGGVKLPRLDVEVGADGARRYRHVDLRFMGSTEAGRRVANLIVRGPAEIGPTNAAEARSAGAAWWPLAAFRELDDALLHLRMSHMSVGAVVLETRGDGERVLGVDAVLDSHLDDGFVGEVLLYMRRVLKRLDNTSKSFFALGDPGSAFAGSLLELALAADRFYLLDDPEAGAWVALSALNGGGLEMGNGLTRLQTRFLGDPAAVSEAVERPGEKLDARAADALEQTYRMAKRDPGGRLVEDDVPLRRPMNELLRDAYVEDCEKVVRSWNKTLDGAGCDDRLRLPSRRFHREQGLYAGLFFDPTGEPISAETWAANRAAWLPGGDELAYVKVTSQ